MRFLSPKDRDVMRQLLCLAEGDLGLVEKVLRESDVPRCGIDLGSIAKSLRARKAAPQKRSAA